MKALVYHGPGIRSYDEKPMPVIKESTDAIRKDHKDNDLWNGPANKELICGF